MSIFSRLIIFTQIHYFGDKYLPDGNDYLIMTQPNIIAHNIDSIEQTQNELDELYELYELYESYIIQKKLKN
jgi:hypothetical protein